MKITKYKTLIFLCVFFTPFFCLSQEDWYHYDWTAQRRFENYDTYTQAYNFVSDKYRNNVYVGQHYKKFASYNALSIADDLNQGRVYTSLSGYESYIRKVLDVLIKDTMIINQVKISFCRSDECNAEMDAAGFLKINIGLMVDIDTEAELALLLGHEIAHYLNDDGIKNYGRWLEIKYLDKSDYPFTPFGLGSIIINYNTLKSYYWFSKEQETEADRYSLKLLRESPYSMASASNLLRLFKRFEIRNTIKYGNRKSNFSTHPDPGDRLNLIKTLVADQVNKQKKNFVVDSLAFMQLKKMCYDETVNLQLVSNHLESLIVLSFTKYLLHPEDKNNLAVLIEALRRTLVFGKNKDIYNKSFILYPYQSNVVSESINYAFLKEGATPSILNYLDMGFVNIWKENLNKIKAHDLADKENIEFTTYMEAYLYFKEKARSANNIPAGHYNYFGQNPDFKSLEDFKAANNVFRTQEYLSEKGAVPVNEKNIFILIPPDAKSLSDISEEMDLKEFRRVNNVLLGEMIGKFGDNVFLMDDLNPGELHLLTSLVGHADYFATPAHIPKMDKTNWIESCPELYTFYKKRNVGNVYVCRIKVKKSKEVYADFYKLSLPGNSYTIVDQQKMFGQIHTREYYVNFPKAAAEFYSFFKAFERS